MFFSFTTDGGGNMKYFNWYQRKLIAKNILYNSNHYRPTEPDDHKNIDIFYLYNNEEQNKRNWYTYDPLLKILIQNHLGNKDDKTIVIKLLAEMDFNNIFPYLIIKPVINPIEIKCNKVEEWMIEELHKWKKTKHIVSNYKKQSKTMCNLKWKYIWSKIYDFPTGDGMWIYMNKVARERGLFKCMYDFSCYEILFVYINSFFITKEEKAEENYWNSAIELWEHGVIISHCKDRYYLINGTGKILYQELADETCKYKSCYIDY